MKAENALRRANLIAKLLHVGSEVLGTTTMSGLNMFGQMSIRMAARANDIEAMNPKLSDIILFGSTARNAGDVEDIDMMVFDHGFYSGILLAEGRSSYIYAQRKTTLLKMLTYWFGFPDGEYSEDEIGVVNSTPIDLLVFPTKFFSDETVQAGIVRQQHDPHFFTNAFRTMMRFDPGKMAFVKYTITQLEQEHNVELSRFTKAIDVN